mgnify:CR=1 FL=1
MTKELALTKGFVALIDDDDHPYLSQWKWTYSGGYALRKEKRGGKAYRIMLHCKSNGLLSCATRPQKTTSHFL